MSNHHITKSLRLHVDLLKFTISDRLNAPRTIMPLYVTDCGPLSLQNLLHKYSLLLVCWRQWLHGSTRLFCIVNISSEQWVQLFVFFSPPLGPQKCSVDKILLLASPASRGSHEEEEEKTGASEHDRPC